MMRWQTTFEELEQRDLTPLVEILRGGGVTILPTDTIYGFHALATDAQAVKRIFEIKERGPAKPLVVIASSIAQARGIGLRFDEAAEAALQAIWPNPLTAILPLEHPVAASAGFATLAVRIPGTAWLRRLLTHTGCLASTSVNRSGEPPLLSIASLAAELEQEVDGIVDTGALEAHASTLVDFTLSPPTVIRQGDFRFAQNLWKTPRKTL